MYTILHKNGNIIIALQYLVADTNDLQAFTAKIAADLYEVIDEFSPARTITAPIHEVVENHPKLVVQDNPLSSHPGFWDFLSRPVNKKKVSE